MKKRIIKLKKKTTKRANRTTGQDGEKRNNQGAYNNKREKNRKPTNRKE
jgi:hypothetical protein